MKRVLAILALAATAIAAQDGKKSDAAPKKPQVQRLFILKYADPTQLRNLLQVFDANVRQDNDMHALTVEASADAMRAIEDAIQKLDVPSAMPKNIEMTVFLLVATNATTTGGSAIPKDLESVVSQLQNAFQFKTYVLLDTLNFRSRTGQAVSATSSSGAVEFGNREISVVSSLRIATIGTESDGGTVRIDKLNCDFRVREGSAASQNLGMQTDVDIKEGQKVVVGRLGISHDNALFLVMMAKVL